MPLIQLVIVLVVFGVILWAINTLHTDGCDHQENLECSRHRCRDSFYIKCLRSIGFPVRASCGKVI